MLSFQQFDREAIERDAANSGGESPQERMAMFADLLDILEAILQPLPPEEHERRRIAEQLDPRAVHWWKNYCPKALAEYQCRTSSD